MSAESKTILYTQRKDALFKLEFLHIVERERERERECLLTETPIDNIKKKIKQLFALKQRLFFVCKK